LVNFAESIDERGDGMGLVYASDNVLGLGSKVTVLRSVEGLVNNREERRNKLCIRYSRD
jgi:hypothetical protein